MPKATELKGEHIRGGSNKTHMNDKKKEREEKKMSEQKINRQMRFICPNCMFENIHTDYMRYNYIFASTNFPRLFHLIKYIIFHFRTVFNV